MAQQSNPPIDLEQLNQISEGDIEFEIEVLQVYVEDILQRIEKLRGAIANKDSTLTMREAHHIKGASSNVGALQMQSLATKIENLHQDEELPFAIEILDEMLEKMKDIELFITEKSASIL
jgi:HPt (histidine-containing phosphotransfer) domain-containing protein